ncbi:permease prefix domain 1-containing protein [Hathewaya limosa]|uniref:Uncharacterized protein n=1 Tax=Hathewaya limosa TaxID=1536 RepID=A0ABU0JU98_HATLI|nr:permease prefix domain 1-containing protein [Hathewaya limosa]MDQ0480682.1 hypothetical protein [Hathewaya limosa]
MREFEIYITNLLKKTNLPVGEREELKMELIQHLNDSKYDYMNEGLSEKQAIQKAIENFNKRDFLTEINGFVDSEKFNDFNLNYFIKMNLTLFISYLLMIVVSVALIKNTIGFNLSYFFIMTVILFLNYECAIMNFQSKKDIIKNMGIVAFSFFFIQKLFMIILAFMHKLLFDKRTVNIEYIRISKLNNLVVYLSILVVTMLLARYVDRDVKKKVTLSILDIGILCFSILLNIVYFLFPDRFYLLNFTISKLLNINVKSFSKNILYMNINNSIVIINIGLLMLLFFIVYKLYLRIIKTRIQHL